MEVLLCAGCRRILVGRFCLLRWLVCPELLKLTARQDAGLFEAMPGDRKARGGEEGGAGAASRPGAGVLEHADLCVEQGR